jgi:glycosyltransferase involved in cell wall biosynthesis
MTPYVSILLPVYNGARYLGAALDSLRAQTFTDFEIVAIDDGSTDETPAILAAYAQREPRLRVLRQATNQGIAAALNAGIAAARGAYLARMDADDVSAPQRLEKQVAFMDAHPEIGACGTGMQNAKAEGSSASLWIPPSAAAVVRWRLLFGNCMSHPTVVMRRAALAALGDGPPYRASAPHAEDYDLWVRLSAHTDIANLPEVLYYRHLHEGSVSRRYAAQQRRSAVEVTQRALGQLLGTDIGFADALDLRRGVSGERLAAAERVDQVRALIGRLHAAYRARYRLTPAERQQISLDAARRLLNLARGNLAPWPGAAAAALGLAVALNPAVLGIAAWRGRRWLTVRLQRARSRRYGSRGGVRP